MKQQEVFLSRYASERGQGVGGEKASWVPAGKHSHTHLSLILWIWLAASNSYHWSTHKLYAKTLFSPPPKHESIGNEAINMFKYIIYMYKIVRKLNIKKQLKFSHWVKHITVFSIWKGKQKHVLNLLFFSLPRKTSQKSYPSLITPAPPICPMPLRAKTTELKQHEK